MLFTADNNIHSETHNGFACSGSIKGKELTQTAVRLLTYSSYRKFLEVV